jgi:predicted nuclease with RNAse H fold
MSGPTRSRRRSARQGPAGTPLDAGVDVGGPGKGFHVAVIAGRRVVVGPVRLPAVREVVAFLRPYRPRLVAVDAPRVPAPDGSRSRPCERLLARQVCPLRFTPDRRALAKNPTYGWVRNGLALFRALERAGLEVVECYPTAAFTRWAGHRGRRSRAAWSEAALRRLGVAGAPGRLGQDGRDALAAALTAAWHAAGRTEQFGEIVVPRARRPARGARPDRWR